MTKRSSRFGMGFLGFLALALARQSAREGRRERVLRLLGRTRDGPGASPQGQAQAQAQAQTAGLSQLPALRPLRASSPVLQGPLPLPALGAGRDPAPMPAGAAGLASEGLRAIQAGRFSRRASLAGGAAWWLQPSDQAWPTQQPWPDHSSTSGPAPTLAPAPGPGPSPQSGWPQAEAFAAAALMLDPATEAALPPWLQTPGGGTPTAFRPGSLTLHPGHARYPGGDQPQYQPRAPYAADQEPHQAQPPGSPSRTEPLPSATLARSQAGPTLAALEQFRTQLAQILREDALRHGLDLKEG